jgi:hypothetical protein
MNIRGARAGRRSSRLGLLNGVPACTDLISKPWVQEAGVEVLDQPLLAEENVATAGGCLSSAYLAGWMIARLEGVQAALHYVAPVEEKKSTSNGRWGISRLTWTIH